MPKREVELAGHNRVVLRFLTQRWWMSRVRGTW